MRQLNLFCRHIDGESNPWVLIEKDSEDKETVINKFKTQHELIEYIGNPSTIFFSQNKDTSWSIHYKV